MAIVMTLEIGHFLSESLRIFPDLQSPCYGNLRIGGRLGSRSILEHYVLVKCSGSVRSVLCHTPPLDLWKRVLKSARFFLAWRYPRNEAQGFHYGRASFFKGQILGYYRLSLCIAFEEPVWFLTPHAYTNAANSSLEKDLVPVKVSQWLQATRLQQEIRGISIEIVELNS